MNFSDIDIFVSFTDFYLGKMRHEKYFDVR